MRRKIVAGNWKMFGTRSQVKQLADGIKQGASSVTGVDIIVFPSFIYLQEVAQILASSQVKWGAQTIYPGENGAFTGEISGSMLADLGCQYVLIGHSERRAIFKEDLNLVAEKFKAAINWNLTPILCVGETREEREQNKTQSIIKEQIVSVVEKVGLEAMSKAIIAYEPVWAIGTGLTATPDQAQEVHAFIRNLLAGYQNDLAKSTRILYGGSVKADNASGLFAMPDIDGGLVGGASLDAKSFLTICQAACEEIIL